MGSRDGCRKGIRIVARAAGRGAARPDRLAWKSGLRLQPPSRRQACRVDGGRFEVGNLGIAAAMKPLLLVLRNCPRAYAWGLIAALAAADTITVPAGLDAYIPVPDSNPLTREKVELGK